MERVTEGGVWETVLADGIAHEGDKYKFKIFGNGCCRYAADPYAFATERQPRDASVVYDLDGYTWRDAGWLAYRQGKALERARMPLNIYELDLGSWKRRPNGDFCSYGEIARELAPYVKQMGYTHIGLTPVTEYARDEGEALGVCSYFAPTSRFGTPNEFKAFVDSMHEAGIGVVLELELSSFSVDALALFDGRPLFERTDGGKMHFDVSRKEVECFLASCACFWFEKYHADGICVDGVLDLIYPSGGRKCLEAVAFFRKLNSYVKGTFPDVVMLSQECDPRGGMTTLEDGGLGFDIIRNVGWTNHTLEYAGRDPQLRNDGVCVPETVAESSLLAISHKDVCGGRQSFINKLGGEYRQKFAGVRAILGYMMTYSGGKLMFMGGELGQLSEWERTSSTEWFLLDRDAHSKLQMYVAELNHLYLTTPCLYRGTLDLYCTGKQGIICYRRADEDNDVITVINLTPTAYENFRLGVPFGGTYREIFNSDDERFGGEGVLNTTKLISRSTSEEDSEKSIAIRIPPLAITILERV